jgi:hypothetical protein
MGFTHQRFLVIFGSENGLSPPFGRQLNDEAHGKPLDLGAKTGQMITPDKAMGLTRSKHVKTPEIAKTWQEAG